MALPLEILSLTTSQRGLATCRQLRELGLSRDALRWRLSREWRLVLPGVVHTDRTDLDPLQRMIAAGCTRARTLS